MLAALGPEVEPVAVREMSNHVNERWAMRTFLLVIQRQSNGTIIGTTEVEFTNTKGCDETDKEENLDGESESYKLLPFHTVVTSSPISMSDKNQHEEISSNTEDLESDFSNLDNEKNSYKSIPNM